MKVDNVSDYVPFFEPKVFQLTFESEAEFKAIKYLFGSHITIPNAIFPDDKAHLRKLMITIFEGLDNVKGE